MNPITRHPNSVFKKDLEKLKAELQRIQKDISLIHTAIVVLSERLNRQSREVDEFMAMFEPPTPPEDPSV